MRQSVTQLNNASKRQISDIFTKINNLMRAFLEMDKKADEFKLWLQPCRLEV